MEDEPLDVLANALNHHNNNNNNTNTNGNGKTRKNIPNFGTSNGSNAISGKLSAHGLAGTKLTDSIQSGQLNLSAGNGTDCPSSNANQLPSSIATAAALAAAGGLSINQIAQVSHAVINCFGQFIYLFIYYSIDYSCCWCSGTTTTTNDVTS